MEEVLVYIKSICKNTDGTFEYDFLFSDTPDFVWGPFWDDNSPALNGDISPESSTYTRTRRVKTNFPLKTLQETTCYSMEYATYGILALAWIDIENLDEYPEKGRLTMYFGTPEKEIEEQLALYNWKFQN